MVNLSKDNIRKSMLLMRNSMKNEEVTLKSEKIIETLLKLPIIKTSNNIMIYMSFNNEVDTFRLLKELKKQKKKVIAPLCNMNNKTITPYEVNDLDKDFVKSKYGFLEPNKEKLNKVNISDIEVIIVPGVAFDVKGNRIGFGAGFYDRFLNNKKNDTVTISLAYDYQIVDLIPNDKFDIPIDFIITEKRIIVR